MAGFLSRLVRRLVPEQRRAGPFGTIGFGTAGAAPGNAIVAENISTVLACVGAISSSVATLPVFVYRSAGGGRVEAPDHPVSRLIRQPNPHQTWPDWVEMTMASALLNGNALSVIESDGNGQVTAVVPVPWQNVIATLLPSGRMAFDVVRFLAPWGGSGAPRRYLDDEVLLLRDRSDDGFLGRSRLSRAPEVLANAASLQAHASSIWANAAQPSGILSMPGSLSTEAAARLRHTWDQAHSGPRNAGKTVVLEDGLTWSGTSASPEDAQVLESRRFAVEEVCRLFQVPPPIVQDYSHGTFTNTAQAALWFAQLTLTPWVRKIEAEFGRSVFGAESDCHIEIDLSGLMRGDYSARWAAYAIAVDKGILTPDEVRQAEGYNPMPAPAEPVAAD